MTKMEHSYHRDMSGADWPRVYERQAQRAGLAADWFEQLELRPGETVVDMGCGPGYFSLLLAERVGPDGLVYAVDRSPEALAHLERLQRERGVVQIRRIASDGLQVRLEGRPADAALVSMMLHHASDAPGLLANVATLLRPDGRLVLAEFHPDGPLEHGPPAGERIPPATARQWCERAGLAVGAEVRQSPEHYLLACRRVG